MTGDEALRAELASLVMAQALDRFPDWTISCKAGPRVCHLYLKSPRGAKFDLQWTTKQARDHADELGTFARELMMIFKREPANVAAQDLLTVD